MRVQKCFSSPSRTKQSFRDECDVNKIVKRFNQVNACDFVTKFGSPGGNFADLTSVPDLRESFDVVERAQTAFSSLPSALRKRFSFSPQVFVDFCLNPANSAELQQLGLSKSPPLLSEKVEAAQLPS